MLHIRFICFVACTFLMVEARAQDFHITGSGYDMHTEINWPAHATADRYRIWKKSGAEASFSELTSTKKRRWMDWTGRMNTLGDSYQYFIEALSLQGNVLNVSDTIEVAVAEMSDDGFLDMVQAHTFRYFYEYGHPTSGMARERLGSGDIVTTGGTGFGIMALLVGVERGYISREEGANRLLKIISFLQIADRFHGVFPHWMNGKNGDVIPFSTFDNGGDLVETAFLMEGLLTARQYFREDNPKEKAIRDIIQILWEDVEWDHHTRNDSGVLYWHWSPDYGWQMNFPLHGWNEALIVYLLSIASPTHPVDASYYHDGWAGSNYVNGNTWYGQKLFVGPHFGGPLFFAHYSFMGFDPRDKKDGYTNYFEQNRNHSLINYGWCKANPLDHAGYSETCWGLTASDNPWGYHAHAPGANTDNGTITPAAAIPSMPYTPEESMAALKHFYRIYGENLWGEYGFFDAFHPGENWFADSYLAIDQGPIINMIENFRTGLLWSHFMSSPEIAPALDAIGFEPDITSSAHHETLQPAAVVFPTIHDGTFFLRVHEPLALYDVKVSLTDITGTAWPVSLRQTDALTFEISTLQSSVSSGLYWVTVDYKNGQILTQPMLIRRDL